MQKELFALLESARKDLATGRYHAVDLSIQLVMGAIGKSSQTQALHIAKEALEYYANMFPGIEIRDGGDKAAEALAAIKETEQGCQPQAPEAYRKLEAWARKLPTIVLKNGELPYAAELNELDDILREIGR